MSLSLCLSVAAGLHGAVSGVLPTTYACATAFRTEAAAEGALPADVTRGRSPAAGGPAHC